MKVLAPRIKEEKKLSFFCAQRVFHVWVVQSVGMCCWPGACTEWAGRRRATRGLGKQDRPQVCFQEGWEVLRKVYLAWSQKGTGFRVFASVMKAL